MSRFENYKHKSSGIWKSKTMVHAMVETMFSHQTPTPPQTSHTHKLLYECDEGSGRQGIVKVPKSVAGMDPPIIAAISEGIPPRVRAKSRSRAIARASFAT